MNIWKDKILENICYTELVYERINKKMKTSLPKKQIEKFVFEILVETNERFYYLIERYQYF